MSFAAGRLIYMCLHLQAVVDIVLLTSNADRSNHLLTAAAFVPSAPAVPLRCANNNRYNCRRRSKSTQGRIDGCNYLGPYRIADDAWQRRLEQPSSRAHHASSVAPLQSITSSAERTSQNLATTRRRAVYDDDEEEECSIDNLDACVTEAGDWLNIDDQDEDDDNLDACVSDELSEEYNDIEGNPDEECSIDNLEACLVSGSTGGTIQRDESVKQPLQQSSSPPSPPSSSSSQRLRRFLANPVVEVQLAVLVLLSSFLVGLGTLQSLPPGIAAAAKDGELLILAVFTVEYVLRWKLEDFSARYIVQPAALIDLLAVLPGLVQFVAMTGVDVPPALLGGALINLRLLRVLRLQRVLKDYETFRKFELALGLDPSDARPWQLQLARVAVSLFTLLSVTAGLIYSAEHNVNPEITDYFTALYFALITLTTVGFGDLSPMTVAGRWVIGGSILVGTAVVPVQAAALVEALINREGEQKGELANAQGGASDQENNASFEKDYLASMEGIVVRMDRLEQKVDETNVRVDRLITLLESKERSKT